MCAAGEQVAKWPVRNNLSHAPDAVFRIWRFREQIEVEAAGVFNSLGLHLSRLRGPLDPVTKLAFKARDDERHHQKLCQAILEKGSYRFAPVDDVPVIALGPHNLPLREQVLYAAVAMGCVTETLSSALLLEMQRRAEPGIIKDTVHTILRDEITHARIGWAELARAKAQGAVDWLNDYLSAMINTAIASDIEPMVATDPGDLTAFGILSRKEALAIMNKAVEDVIKPGLKKYGLIFSSTKLLADINSTTC